MITYPPLRLAVPCILGSAGLALLASDTQGTSRRKFTIGLSVSAVVLVGCFLPILLDTIRGKDNVRLMYVSIFEPSWLDQHRGDVGRVKFFTFTMLDNLWLHLRPSYLFGIGDPNLRHSAHIVGELSPLDILAVCLAVAGLTRVAWLGFRQMTQRELPRWPRIDRRDQMLIGVALLSMVAGMFATLPAALTWEGLPHALRTIGAWPFVALFSGAVLSIGWSRLRWLPSVAAIVAVAYTGYFLPEYFRIYKNVDSSIFYRELSEAVAARKRAASPTSVRHALQPFARSYDPHVIQYFLMHDGGMKCQESLAMSKRMHGRR